MNEGNRLRAALAATAFMTAACTPSSHAYELTQGSSHLATPAISVIHSSSDFLPSPTTTIVPRPSESPSTTPFDAEVLTQVPSFTLEGTVDTIVHIRGQDWAVFSPTSAFLERVEKINPQGAHWKKFLVGIDDMINFSSDFLRTLDTSNVLTISIPALLDSDEIDATPIYLPPEATPLQRLRRMGATNGGMLLGISGPGLYFSAPTADQVTIANS